jgi:hypothetical protein
VLVEVDLSGNGICEAGARALAAGIAGSSSLAAVILDNNSIREEGGLVVKAAVEQNRGAVRGRAAGGVLAAWRGTGAEPMWGAASIARLRTMQGAATKAGVQLGRKRRPEAMGTGRCGRRRHISRVRGQGSGACCESEPLHSNQTM